MSTGSSWVNIQTSASAESGEFEEPTDFVVFVDFDAVGETEVAPSSDLATEAEFAEIGDFQVDVDTSAVGIDHEMELVEFEATGSDVVGAPEVSEGGEDIEVAALEFGATGLFWAEPVVVRAEGTRTLLLTPSAAVSQALSGPVVDVWRAVDILDRDENMWAERVGFTEGSVSIDMSRDERRTLDITFENVDRSMSIDVEGFWLDKVIRPRRGVTIEGYHFEFDLGYFVVDRMGDQHDKTTVSVTCRDYSKIMLLDKTPAALTFKKGTAIELIVKAEAGLCGIKRIMVPVTGMVLDQDVSFDADTPRWSICKKVCDDFGYDLFFDASGTLVMRRQVDPVTTPSILTFGQSAGNTVSLDRGITDENLFNHIVVAVENSGTGLPIWVELENTEPSSPTRVGGSLGRRTKRVVTNLASTQAQLMQMAMDYLRIGALEQYEISFESLNYPWLDVGNVITVADDEASPYDPDKYLLSSLSIPLGLGAMSGTCRRVSIITTPELVAA